MKSLALVTSSTWIAEDYDMPLLLNACRASELQAQVCDWEDSTIDWARFDAVILRSPWNYAEKFQKFLLWCERVSTLTQLFNPAQVAHWGLNKQYLADLAMHKVPIVATSYVGPEEDPHAAIHAFLTSHPNATEFVVKPTIGAYSKNVKRFLRNLTGQASIYIQQLHTLGHRVILQPYLASIDQHGETNLTYFSGVYSHAIRKSPLLLADGTVNVPTPDFRKARVADQDEREVATLALEAAKKQLGLEHPLLYGRVDLIRDDGGRPVVLELDICEPSLNLPLSDGSAMRFVRAIEQRLNMAMPTKKVEIFYE